MLLLCWLHVPMYKIITVEHFINSNVQHSLLVDVAQKN